MHKSHDIVEVEPRHTSANQQPVRADHENHVHFNPSRSVALITGSANGRRESDEALSVRYIPEGSNALLDPPRLWLTRLGGQPVVVTVESLLYAIKQMQDAVAGPVVDGS